jgi:hypothetical protein
MAKETKTPAGSVQNQTVEEEIQQLRRLYGDAPQYAKTALENTLRDLTSAASQPRSRMESAGRIGTRHGTVSDSTVGSLMTNCANVGCARASDTAAMALTSAKRKRN